MSQTASGEKRLRGRPVGSGKLCAPVEKTVNLDRADWERLQNLAWARGCSAAAVIRAAVREYLDRVEAG